MEKGITTTFMTYFTLITKEKQKINFTLFYTLNQCSQQNYFYIHSNILRKTPKPNSYVEINQFSDICSLI